MGKVTIQIPEELLNRINELAFKSSRTKSYLIIQAIGEHISELEDFYLAEMRLIELKAKRTSTHSLNNVKEKLDLAD